LYNNDAFSINEASKERKKEAPNTDETCSENTAAQDQHQPTTQKEVDQIIDQTICAAAGKLCQEFPFSQLGTSVSNHKLSYKHSTKITT
jgi:hypothetical protein